MKLAHYRKTAAVTLGVAAEIALRVPQDSPAWRYAQLVVAVATIAGVYRVRNAPPPVEPPPSPVTEKL